MDKRLVFCLTLGRSGTAYLAQVLDRYPCVVARHEPEPDFVDWARAARRDPQEARLFWEKKLAAIGELVDCDVYVETSHLFGKGFVEPLLELGIIPDVIVLHRDLRDVALSYWRRNSIPARTINGIRYLLHPHKAQFVPAPQWWRLSDYQLCYWYALEMSERIDDKVMAIEAAGGNCARIPFETLTSPDFWESLDDGQRRRAIGDLPDKPVNATPLELKRKMPPEIDAQELAVWENAKREVEPDDRIAVDIVVLTANDIHQDLATALVQASRDRRFRVTVGPAFANPTSNNRCQIVREFVDNELEPDWLMMIDHDTVPRGDFLRWCETDEWDVLAFVTPCWKPTSSPEMPIVWNVELEAGTQEFPPAINDPDVEVFAQRLPTDQEVIEVASAGTGAMLIHRRVLEHPDFRAPFVDEFNEFGIRTEGHDLAFCRRAREAGFRVGAVLKPPCSHYKEIDLLAVASAIGRRL